MICPRCQGCLMSEVQVDGWQDKCVNCGWRGSWHERPRPRIERPVVKGQWEDDLTPERRKRKAYEAERARQGLCVDCANPAHVGTDCLRRRRCLSCLMRARQRVKVARG